MINTLESIVTKLGEDGVNSVDDLINAQPEPFRTSLQLGVQFLEEEYRWKSLPQVSAHVWQFN